MLLTFAKPVLMISASVCLLGLTGCETHTETDALVGGGCRVKQHPRHDVLHARGEPREQLVVLAERVAHRRLRRRAAGRADRQRRARPRRARCRPDAARRAARRAALGELGGGGSGGGGGG